MWLQSSDTGRILLTASLDWKQKVAMFGVDGVCFAEWDTNEEEERSAGSSQLGRVNTSIKLHSLWQVRTKKKEEDHPIKTNLDLNKTHSLEKPEIIANYFYDDHIKIIYW